MRVSKCKYCTVHGTVGQTLIEMKTKSTVGPPRAGSTPLGALSRDKQTSEMYKLIEIVVRNMISESDLQTKKQADSMINKAVASVASSIRQDLAAMNSRLANVEAGLAAMQISVSENHKVLFEKCVQTQLDFQRQDKEVRERLDDHHSRTTVFTEKLHAKQKESSEFINRSLLEVRDEARKTTYLLGDDLRMQSREIARIRECVDTL
jgi:hypothetical protein